ncbi:hypothetical protein J7J84_01275, partial [bacterium]|nr:hypothetical protein [bacterium]
LPVGCGIPPGAETLPFFKTGSHPLVRNNPAKSRAGEPGVLIGGTEDCAVIFSCQLSVVN